MDDTAPGTQTRRSGILLHPTSLPGPGPNGVLDENARWFVDFLVSARQQVWQVLPLVPPDGGGSPYASRSAFAIGAHLEDPRNDLPPTTDEYLEFEQVAGGWLDDWALYSALRERFAGRPWWLWPGGLASRDPDELTGARRALAPAIARERARQLRLWRQWRRIRRYANEHGIEILGDIPIFVDHDSADVWANQRVFKLEESGHTRVVTGVPPDLFSETGQRWGNPHYDWDAMAADGYGWWIERLRWAKELFDFVRIDHFRGFAAAWEIPAASETAIAGEWVPGPGKPLFDAIAAAIGPIPMVAEDLGIITPDVVALRKSLDVPGMAVLQFAFGGDAMNPYLPHNIEHDSVVYTGTHDNDTTAGWLASLEPHAREHLRRYLALVEAEIPPTELVRVAQASVARTAIIPFQDVLGLGTEARMNLPGTTRGNWHWRFSWDQVTQQQADWLRELGERYGRGGRPPGEGR